MTKWVWFGERAEKICNKGLLEKAPKKKFVVLLYVHIRNVIDMNIMKAYTQC